MSIFIKHSLNVSLLAIGKQIFPMCVLAFFTTSKLDCGCRLGCIHTVYKDFCNLTWQITWKSSSSFAVRLIGSVYSYCRRSYMNYASYNGYIKKLLGLIFILSDDFSMFKAKDNRDSDLLMCFTYHTHNVYLKDREITEFE